ncbi:MAG: type II toxin-antitoxin system RelE/ParE family toxin [Pseudomonadota bacterium]
MVYDVLRSEASDRDLDLIFDHLFETYVDFGEAPGEALARAGDRVRAIEDEMEALGRQPFQGTLCPNLASGWRRVTKNRVIIYFTVDEQAATVRILAVFFGGQDHRRHMLKRLLGSSDP